MDAWLWLGRGDFFIGVAATPGNTIATINMHRAYGSCIDVSNGSMRPTTYLKCFHFLKQFGCRGNVSDFCLFDD